MVDPLNITGQGMANAYQGVKPPVDAVRQVERRDAGERGGFNVGNSTAGQGRRAEQPERWQPTYSANADDYEQGAPRGSYLNIVV